MDWIFLSVFSGIGLLVFIVIFTNPVILILNEGGESPERQVLQNLVPKFLFVLKLWCLIVLTVFFINLFSGTIPYSLGALILMIKTYGVELFSLRRSELLEIGLDPRKYLDGLGSLVLGILVIIFHIQMSKITEALFKSLPPIKKN